MRTTPVNADFIVVNGSGTGSNGNRIDVWVEYKVQSQSIENNTSLIDVYFYAKLQDVKSSATWGSSGRTSTLTVNGTASSASGGYDFRSPSRPLNTFGQQTGVVVAHNADGTMQIAITATFKTSSSYISGGNVSATIALPTIPRATIPQIADSVTLGEAAAVTLSPASASFTHTLRYVFGGASGTFATQTAETSLSVTFPTTLAEQIPNASSGSCTLYCDTYSGDVLIGTGVKAITLTVPQSLAPTVGAITHSEAASGLAAQFGVYVQLHSKLALLVTAAAQQGATIAAYLWAVNGQTISGQQVTTSELASSGNNAISCKVTDSRGLSTTVTASVNVVEYQSPSVASFSVYRCDAAGTADDDGANVKCEIVGTISPVNDGSTDKNTKIVRVGVKKTSETSYVYTNVTASFAINTSVIIPSIDVDYPYDIRLELTDFFTTASADSGVATSFTLLDFYASGKGLAFGGAAAQDGLHCKMPARFSDDLTFDDAAQAREALGVVSAAETIQRSANGFCKVISGDIRSTAIPTGLYAGSELTNAPVTSWLYYIVMRHSVNYCKILAFDFFSNVTWVTYCNNGTWGAWEAL